MREIKFRGLRTDGKGWVYGYYYEYSGKHIICWQNHSDNATTDHFAEVIPESVGQFTGLLDRNGKEIYEGDKTYWGAIIWNNEKSLFAEHFYQEAIQKWSISSYPISVDRMEIIGNIHENPDLI